MSEELSAAILAHQTWVARFQNAVKGIDREVQNPDLVRDDTICQFGRWLYANPTAFSRPEVYERVKTMHRAFHMAAGEIAVMLQQHQSSETLERHMRALRDQSKQLAHALMAEKLALENNTAGEPSKP